MLQSMQSVTIIARVWRKGQHVDAVGLTLLPHSARDPGSIPSLGYCVESAHSPRGFPPGAPVSKGVRVRWIGHAKFVSRGLARVNAWGYGDRAWVGLWSVQTQWTKWPPSALHCRIL